MAEKKFDICPIMSGPVAIDGGVTVINKEIECIKHRCRLWIEVFTTELIRTQGCTYELEPQMVDGQLRV